MTYTCHYIESYRDKETGKQRVSVFQRGNYLYELTRVARHIRWFNDMSLDEVRAQLALDGYILEEVNHG